MKKYLAILVALTATLLTSNSFAWNPPSSPAPSSWISDSSGVLSAEAHARLDAKLKQINQSSANELAALILPSLDGEDIRDVGSATAKSWGVGKKNLDNGVLVVLAMKDHRSAIETGKGAEGDLPDLKCNDILQAARPYLRNGDVEGALGFIFDGAATAIANHKADMAAGRSSSSSSNCDIAGGLGLVGGDAGWLLIVCILAAGTLFSYLNFRTSRRRQQEEKLSQFQNETDRLRNQILVELQRTIKTTNKSSDSGSVSSSDR